MRWIVWGKRAETDHRVVVQFIIGEIEAPMNANAAMRIAYLPKYR